MSNVKNLQAFEKLLGICTGLGEKYNPGQQNLRIENLSLLLANARAALLAVNTAQTGFENATNHREVIYEDIGKLAGRIVSELKSSGVLEQTIADARMMARKLNGYRASRDPIPSEAMANAAEATTKKRTAMGLDFSTRAHHFEKLLQTVISEPNYHPNVDDLKVPALEATLVDLRMSNSTLIYAMADLGAARMQRNNLLYNDKGNLYETAQAVKHQVRAIFGFSSEPFKAVRAIRFYRAKI